MRKLICAAWLAVFGASFFIVAPASAAPSVVAAPAVETPFTLAAGKYGPPGGKHCVKWTRRYHSSLGFGHRRCIHWK